MLDKGIIEDVEETEDCITFFTGYETRTMHFAERDSVTRIRDAIITDSAVTRYIELNALIELIYQHIDLNSLMPLENVVLLWDKHDDEGELVPKEARNALYDMYGDEYAFEISEGNLGIVWVERSSVIINVSEIMQTAKEMWSEKDLYEPVGMSEWNNKDDVFKDIFVSTLCHEFRHLLYECNECVKIGEGTPYAETGYTEEEVEKYGNSEAFRLFHDNHARILIDNAVKISKGKAQSFERD
jgi:hypothetical protein